MVVLLLKLVSMVMSWFCLMLLLVREYHRVIFVARVLSLECIKFIVKKGLFLKKEKMKVK